MIEPFILTASGVKFYPLDPKPEMIRLSDIARALAKAPRFGGHTLYDYSVAQHSIWVSENCSPLDAAYGLFHDAAEAYLLDLPTPIKQHMPVYEEAERKIAAVIYEVLGLDPSIIKTPSVAEADNEALLLERSILLPESEHWPIAPELKPSPGAYPHPLVEKQSVLRKQIEREPSSRAAAGKFIERAVETLARFGRQAVFS